jgi:hypothetical protein
MMLRQHAHAMSQPAPQAMRPMLQVYWLKQLLTLVGKQCHSPHPAQSRAAASRPW